MIETDDQAKIADLEKQLTDKVNEYEEKLEATEKEKVEMQDR
jgi:hypothetical protein